MRVLVVSPRLVPFPTGFGSAVHLWSIVEGLVKRGHKVDFCVYDYTKALQNDDPFDRQAAMGIRALESMGVQLHYLAKLPHAEQISQRWRERLFAKTVSPRIDHFYDGTRYQEAISSLVSQLHPHAVIAWTVDAAAATQGCRTAAVPRLVSLTDLDHKARSYRRKLHRQRGLKNAAAYLCTVISDWAFPSIIIKLLRDCEVVYDHAAHHCRWLQNHGVVHAKYAPVPVLDSAPGDWADRRCQLEAKQERPRVTLIGRVAGTATLPGLQLMAARMMQHLDTLQKKAPFELHIVGGGSLPKNLTETLERPYVHIRGFVEDIHSEFLSSAVVFVPTPIDLGFRTRIAEAFSFGCCVVAHTANSLGMPELINGSNCLLASNGKGLALAISEALEDANIRQRLQAAARRTFEDSLKGETIVSKMVDTLEAAVRR